MKTVPMILATIVAGLAFESAGDDFTRKRILEFTIRDPIEESFAIETTLVDAFEGRIVVRQFRPVAQRLDPEHPDLEMFELELTETWVPGARIIDYAGESAPNRVPLKVGEEMAEVERFRKLWNRGNTTEKHGGETYIARTEQGRVTD